MSKTTRADLVEEVAVARPAPPAYGVDRTRWLSRSRPASRLACFHARCVVTSSD